MLEQRFSNQLTSLLKSPLGIVHKTLSWQVASHTVDSAKRTTKIAQSQMLRKLYSQMCWSTLVSSAMPSGKSHQRSATRSREKTPLHAGPVSGTHARMSPPALRSCSSHTSAAFAATTMPAFFMASASKAGKRPRRWACAYRRSRIGV